MLVDKTILLGAEAVLKGRSPGKSGPFGKHAGGGAIGMLSEIQTGLRFTEVQVLNMRKCLLPTVRLAEACTETLAKLLYSIDSIVNPIASRVSALPWPSTSRGKSVITLRHQVTGSLS